MRRSRILKSQIKTITFKVPKSLIPLIDSGANTADLDRSKFIRSAIREKLARCGIIDQAA